MRKIFLIVAMMLVPALASAWTLPVKVTNTSPGIAAGNAVTVTYTGVPVVPAGANVVTAGTKYFYPANTVASASIAIANIGSVASITLDGVVQPIATPVVVTKGLATLHSVNVVYNSAASAPTRDINITQSFGGLTSISIGQASTTNKFTGVVVGTGVTVKAQPNIGYKLTSITVNGVASVVNAGATSAVTESFAVTSATPNTVTAAYEVAPASSAVLSIPGSNVTGNAVSVSVFASSNVVGLTYDFDFDNNAVCGAADVLGSASNAVALTPSATGLCNVIATVHTPGGADVTVNGFMNVADGTAAANFGCTGCHNNSTPAVIAAYNAGTHPSGVLIAPTTMACTTCHTQAAHTSTTCVGCHAINQNAGANFVQDNSGVRAVTQEFSKWSHHVTGVALNDAHCAACHLEGKVENGKIVVDNTKHMSDATTHLRNADTDADFVWNPATPNHGNMDNFCMSCHDANGATSAGSAAIQALINATPNLAAAGKTASASNPFGDTISNRYDKMFRPAVVNVDDQFDTTNNSHHGVKGKRYTGKSREAGSRQILSPATFANNSTATLYGKRSTIYDSVNAISGVSEKATNPAFVATYAPLGTVVPPTAATELGDDSTLHCGDCHTVGQWKANAATNAAGVLNTVVIGAHGSNNEYMLRNDQGSDERHTQEAYVTTAGTTTYQAPNSARLVCYNCHSFKRYGSVYNATGVAGPHAGEYDSAGRCNGVGNTIPFNGYTTGKATDGTQFTSRFDGPKAAHSSTPAFAPGFPLNFANAPGGVQAATYTGEQEPDFGNIFGIQCLNCHNSGIGNGYGGIHGSALNSPGTVNTGTPAVPAPAGGAYVNGMGNWSKVERFLPGLGDIMHVPGTLGGVTGGTLTGSAALTYSYTTGGISNDTNWEQVGWKQTAAGPVAGATGLGAGCYTLSESATAATAGLEGESVDGGATPEAEAFGTWGGCDDHGAAKGAGDHGFAKRINRPVTY